MKFAKKIILIFIVVVMMFSFGQVAFATNQPTLVTTDYVNLRSSPEIGDNIIATVAHNATVDVLIHDPTAWSRVQIGGNTGYIRSDLLTIPAGGSGVRFRTTGGVNLRGEASTDSIILALVAEDTAVDVLEHAPTGWSRVRVDGRTGFIRSDLLSRTAESTLGTPFAAPPTPTTPTPPAGQTTTPPTTTTAPTAPTTPATQSAGGTAPVGSTLRTTASVNLRSGPSTDHSIVRTIAPGTAVTVQGHTNGWTRVSVGEHAGYIRADLLRGQVELLEWSEVRTLMRNGVPMRVVDVRTGISFNLQSFSIGDHADVEPPTLADTEAKLSSRGGRWSWAPRPVWVTINGRTIAGALAGMPHDVSTIPDNGVNGHFCLHFRGSTTTSTSATYRRDLQNAVTEAFEAGNR